MVIGGQGDGAGRTPRGVRPGQARFAGLQARGVVDHVDVPPGGSWQPDGGLWAVVADFEGRVRAWRFAQVDHDRPEVGGRPPEAWTGPEPESWQSSLDRGAYVAAVERVRAAVREGEVYQVNVCRVLCAPLPAGPDGPPSSALAGLLGRQNPAPYAATVHVPPSPAAGDPGVWVVSASPELFLEVRDGQVTSGPIKGTATTPDGLGLKDEAENIMITDLVRNDLQRACHPGTVEVIDLLAREQHPGLVHLVSRIRGSLLEAVPRWDALMAATYPPASVSGAPKAAALGVIGELEPVPRGPYCGAVGWWDADAGTAVLAVAIRTFWWTDEAGGTLRFGTGAGITWGSDPEQEWAETELKAARLVALASAAGPRVGGVAAAGGAGSGKDEGPDKREGP